MKFSKVMLTVAVSLVAHATTYAAVSVEEAKQLGTNLTLFGAEKAGNKDGTIPEYTGGLPTNTAPPGFAPKSGRWADPFANEKPLYSINAQNVTKYADKLSAGAQELIKRNPTFRIDVYPTHRTIAYPKYVLDNTVANATRAKSVKNNLSVEGALGGIPFPIPKSGYEVMWNHLMRYTGEGQEYFARNYYVDANGRPTMAGDYHHTVSSPYYKPDITMEQFKKTGGSYLQAAFCMKGPARVVGDCTLMLDNVDPVAAPRRAWSYSASTRRVRLAPDLGYDTPMASLGGVKTYDDAELYMSKMDRFDFKLIGKKELLIPYNNNRAQFFTPPEKLMESKFANPDAFRWELHRVWVVEATLKPEFRHIYSKRVFYLDEDGSGAGLQDAWDSSGKLFKFQGQGMVQLYDVQRSIAKISFAYDLSTGLYSISADMSSPKTGFYAKDDQQQIMFTPDALPARSGR